jgi:hypothetical protein
MDTGGAGEEISRRIDTNRLRTGAQIPAAFSRRVSSVREPFFIEAFLARSCVGTRSSSASC